MPVHFREVVVENIETKERVDRYVASVLVDISRSLIGDERTILTINGKEVKKSKLVNNQDVVTITWHDDLFKDIVGQNIPLNVLYEDDSVLVINKASGMVVHPGAGNPDQTLVNALVHRYGPEFMALDEDESDIDDDEEINSLRPGIVHRLDKDTSGVMVVARTRKAQNELARQFREHTVDKYYIAIVKGRMHARRGKIITGICRNPKNRKRFSVCDQGKGKYAETHYLVLKQYPDYALVRIRILTGRTHQIRVHMKSIGHPVLGDVLYGGIDKNFTDCQLMLHAFQLTFCHPESSESVRFRAPLPKRFKTILYSFRGRPA